MSFNFLARVRLASRWQGEITPPWPLWQSDSGGLLVSESLKGRPKLILTWYPPWSSRFSTAPGSLSASQSYTSLSHPGEIVFVLHLPGGVGQVSESLLQLTAL